MKNVSAALPFQWLLKELTGVNWHAQHSNIFGSRD